MDYVFMTDSNSDMPYPFRDQYDVPLVYMPYYLGDVEYFSDLGRGSLYQELFDRMRKGEVPSTSLLSPGRYVELLEPVVKDNDILFLAFSSQLSTTFDNLCMARDELLEKYPGRKFMIVDTMSISGAEFILIRHAHELYRQGKPMEEIAKWVENHRMRVQTWLTVDDLVYLKRGGRISGTSAFFGSMLSLKPILVIGKNGRICPAEKVQGKKKALRVIAEKAAQNIERPEAQSIVVMHADIVEEAEFLKELLIQKIPGASVEIVRVGPVIGTHCGPGTVAACFLGKEREI